MDNSIVENQTHLKTLTEGIHSKEALQLVREHVLGVMGPASMAYSSSMIKMAKLQVCLLLVLRNWQTAWLLSRETVQCRLALFSCLLGQILYAFEHAASSQACCWE